MVLQKCLTTTKSISLNKTFKQVKIYRNKKTFDGNFDKLIDSVLRKDKIKEHLLNGL